MAAHGTFSSAKSYSREPSGSIARRENSLNNPYLALPNKKVIRIYYEKDVFLVKLAISFLNDIF